MPSHFGTGTMLRNVSLGAVMMPMKRANRFFGAGVTPTAAAALFISFGSGTRGLYHALYDAACSKVSLSDSAKSHARSDLAINSDKLHRMRALLFLLPCCLLVTTTPVAAQSSPPV